MFNERHTDAGNAKWFARAFGETVRYLRERGGWIVNRSTHWRDDVDGEVERLAKSALDGMFKSAAEADIPRDLRDAVIKHALRSEQAPRIAAALSLLRSETGITIAQAALDSDPWLLGVRNGAVDLRTGNFGLPASGAYITRQVATDFSPHGRCPTWLAFLDRVMAGDAGMVEYLQRAIGYSLSGDINEQCVFVAHGPGANGKSVFERTISDLLGTYAAYTPADTFTHRREGTASNDLARLAGTRFVSAAELDEGRRLAEALVKLATGGEPLTVRFLYGEYFELAVRFKLWLFVNHKPVIRGDDNGIWRRIRLLPFGVTIPPQDQDHHLAEKLRLEFPGILNWAIEGCLNWQRDGLGAPAAVISATDSYRHESDALAEWLRERCVTDDTTMSTQAKRLYDDYRKFIEERGGMALSMKRWAQRMVDRGFTKDDGRIVHYLGIALCDLCDLRDRYPLTSQYSRT